VKSIFRGANLCEANLNEALLSGAEFYYANLGKATLMKANLSNAILTYAWLNNADLSNADLGGSFLVNASLREANLSNAYLKGANFSDADLSDANLNHANLSGAILVGTNLTRANLTNCFVYGISCWDVVLEQTKQLNLVITPPRQPTITVDNLKVAQFLYLLLNNEEIRDVLNSVMERGVLLLGRFSDGGLDLLQAIAAKLRDMKYLPILFDFERPINRNFTETVKILVGLSRFVIVDLSGSSVPQDLYATIPHFKIPFVPIIEKGRKLYSMFPDLAEYPWVLKPVVEFESKEQLMELLPSMVIKPAEERFRERKKLLEQLFNS
jgi:hypothetical protein